MVSERVAMAHEGIAAFNAADYERMLEFVHPDVEAYVPEELPTQGTYHGHEGFMTLVRQWGEAWESFEIVPEEYIERGEFVIIPSIGRGRGLHSGVTLEMHLTYLFTVVDGKLTRWAMYRNMDEALAAAGFT